ATETYASALQGFAHALGLGDAVILHESVSGGELAAHYRAADALVVVSEHEGFSVPLIEAMVHGTPIVAYSNCAVPETLGDGGLLLPDKSPALVATAVHKVMSDDTFRVNLVQAGRDRLAHFDLARSRRRLIAALAPLTGVTP
ncbi:MAG TPA: glycosyltransferase, partial [Acidimicrobiales bacterium]|nr:glycosyltransferase [Acidimicrobiales bacterium]